jgi:hypothetical protein
VFQMLVESVVVLFANVRLRGDYLQVQLPRPN